MTIKILCGEVIERLRDIPSDSVDCVVTSPPYWGLRSYLPTDHPDKRFEIGMERTLGEHIDVLVRVFEEMRRVMKHDAAFWLNYGDCYATTPNGRSAAETKIAGNDDRTFRDKPFSTIGPIYDPKHEAGDRRGGECKQRTHDNGQEQHTGRIVAGGFLKPKDLCLIPFRLVIAMQEAGWWVRSRCVWGKPNPMPDSSGRYRPSIAHEEIFLLSKSGDLKYDADAVSAPCSESTHARLAQDVQNQIGSARANGGHKTNGNMKAVTRRRDTVDGARTPGSRPHSLSKYEARKIAEAASGIRNNKNMDDALSIMPLRRFLRTYEPEVWHIATEAFSGAHFATFPCALVERCLMASTKPGDHVLDPFGGAGTVGLIADRMGRDATLIELNSDYVEIAKSRIENDSPLFVDCQLT